jgi:translation initiation factor 4E
MGLFLQMLACIGEQFPEGDEICGVAVNIRQKGDRIELWTKTSSNEAVQVGVGHVFQQHGVSSVVVT